MTSTIAAIAVDARDPGRVAAFWAEALGWVVAETWEGGVGVRPHGPGPVLGIDVLAVPEGKTVKNRVHLDLRADGTSQEAEVERLLALGARRADVGQGPEATWVVLADPEGNEFCVLARSVEEVVAEEVGSAEEPGPAAL